MLCWIRGDLKPDKATLIVEGVVLLAILQISAEHRYPPAAVVAVCAFFIDGAREISELRKPALCGVLLAACIGIAGPLRLLNHSKDF
ncbi:MAG: hypothetical protein MHM6MM_001308 [Cercozoa sp. M6MM]